MTKKKRWLCLGCGARGDGDIMICPECKQGDRARWACAECWTEGRGQRPDECPTCGCEDSWYQCAPADDDDRTMRAIFDELMDGIFSPSRSRH